MYIILCFTAVSPSTLDVHPLQVLIYTSAVLSSIWEDSTLSAVRTTYLYTQFNQRCQDDNVKGVLGWLCE